MAFDLNDLEAAELQTFLAEKYNTPSAEWLIGLERQFGALQALLEQGNAPTQNESNDSDNEESTSPSAARAAALPAVKLIYRTLLIGTDESLVCYAFGTISQSLFEDIFWQKIDEARNETPETGAEVYKARAGHFELRFGGYHFDISYDRWEGLVRKHSNILDAPVAFLKEREAEEVYTRVTKTQGIRMGHDRLVSALGPDVFGMAFYYLRAHAIERGTFHNSFLLRHEGRFMHTQHILCLIEKALTRLTKRGDPWSLQHVVAEVFNGILAGETFVSQCHTCREPLPERTPPALTPLSQSVLMRVRAQPIAAKLDFPSFIKINVEYNGSSSISHGELLGIIEGHIERLRISILKLPKMIVAKDARPSCIVWPGRLFETSMETTKVNNWVYIMGIKAAKADSETQGELESVVDSWTHTLVSREDFDGSSCFVSANLLDSSEMTGTFINSTESFRRNPISGPKRNEVTVESPKSNNTPKKNKKKLQEKLQQQKQELSNSGPSSSLRTASDVLSRLKYDPNTFDIDDFKIGYEDRVEGRIKEKPAADWELDTQHDEFIPEHRIQYFKKCPPNGQSPEIMWDKGKRIDRFFNSGNSRQP
ncbi:hypothetical protein BKA65DRAFT_188722 [Rhexocercosporidium sp. MPI-PUGE-AT-0058]|nr:hypothetical protein BKA65DRAFT_188722 [Rhexocercosporidium sp. MPI-PUGE-AT-0058]